MVVVVVLEAMVSESNDDSVEDCDFDFVDVVVEDNGLVSDSGDWLDLVGEEEDDDTGDSNAEDASFALAKTGFAGFCRSRSTI